MRWSRREGSRRERRANRARAGPARTGCLRRIAVRAFAVAALALALAYLSRDAWTAALVRRTLASALDAEVELDRVTWRGLSRVEVRGLAFGSTTSALRSARVGELDAEFDLVRVLRTGIAGIERVQARGVEVALAPPARTSAAIPRATVALAPAPELFAALAALPRVELTGLALRAELGDGAALALDDAQVELAPAAGQVACTLRARALALHAAGRTHAGALALAGDLEPGAWTLSSFTWEGLVDAARADARTIDADGALVFHARLGARESELRADGRVLGGRARVNAELRVREIERWLALADDSAFAGTTGALEAELHADIPLDDPAALSGGADVRARGLVFRGAGIEWLHADVRADRGRVFVPELAVLCGANELALAAVELPAHWTDPCALATESSGRFELHVRDVTALPPPLHAFALHLERADASGRWSDGLASIDTAELASARGVCHVRSATLPLVLDASIFSHPASALDFELDLTDLAELAPFTGGRALAGTLHADAQLRARASGPAGHVALDASGLTLDGRALGDASFAAELDGSILDLEHFSARGVFGVLHARGRVDVARWTCAGLAVDGTLALAADGSIARAAEDTFGSARVQAWLDGAWPELDGWMHVAARLPARAASSSATSTSGAQARGATPRDTGARPERGVVLDTRLARGELLVDEFTFRSTRTEVHARGTCANLASLVREPRSACVRVEALSGSIAERPFALARAVDASFGPGRLELGTVELDTALGKLSADCDWTRDRARLRAHAEGPIAIDLDLDVPLGLDANGALTSRGEARVRAHVAAEDLALAAELAELTGRGLGGRLALDADLRGPAHALRGKLAVSARAVELAGLIDPWLASAALAGPLSLDGEIEAADDVTIRGLRLEHAHARVDVDGRIAGPLDAVALLARERAAWDAVPLELNLRASGDELGPLAAFVPALRRVGGRFTAEVRVRGTGADPELHGTGTLADGELRLDGFPVTWSRLTADVEFDAHKLTLTRLAGELGGAPFTAQGELWPFGAEPKLDVRLAGANLLFVRTPDLRLRADMDLRVAGPLKQAHVTGELALRGSRYERDFDVLSQLGSRRKAGRSDRARPLFELDAPLDAITFDVRVRTAEPFRIENDIVRAGLRPELRLQGTGALPFVTGRITFEPGTLRLPAANVRVLSGSLEYLATDPFVARLEARAETRVQGYDVTLRASGTLAEPVVELSSIPPLAQDDLVLLVLTGQAPSTPFQRGGGVVARNVSVYVARDLLRDWLRGDLGKLLVDSLEVETAEDVSRTGVESVRARLLVKRFGSEGRSDLFLTGERDVYEHYNFGVRIVFRFP